MECGSHAHHKQLNYCAPSNGHDGRLIRYLYTCTSRTARITSTYVHLQVHRITGDGSCMFRAVVQGLAQAVSGVLQQTMVCPGVWQWKPDNYATRTAVMGDEAAMAECCLKLD